MPAPSPWHPMDYLEPEEGIDTDDLEKLGRCDHEVLATLMRVVFFADVGRGPQLKACFARMVAVAHALHVPGVGEKSLTALAEEIGVTKSLLSLYAVTIRDFAGLDHAAGKSVRGRKAYSDAQIWRARKRSQGSAQGKAGAGCHSDGANALKGTQEGRNEQ